MHTDGQNDEPDKGCQLTDEKLRRAYLRGERRRVQPPAADEEDDSPDQERCAAGRALNNGRFHPGSLGHVGSSLAVGRRAWGDHDGARAASAEGRGRSFSIAPGRASSRSRVVLVASLHTRL